MDDDDDVRFQDPEPGRWASYEWVVSTIGDYSVTCREATGRFLIKNVGAADGGLCWYQSEFVHDRSSSTDSLIFKLLVDPKIPFDQRMRSPTGWFQFNNEPVKPFKTFRPNNFPDLCHLMQQVCGTALSPIRGAMEHHESLGMKTISYFRGQLECTGTSTVAVKDCPIGSEQTLRVNTNRTIWRNGAIPFYDVVESHVVVEQRLLVESEIPAEPGSTSALHLADFGREATSRLQ